MAEQKKTLTFDAENAAILAELCVDPRTSESVKVQIVNKLLENRKEDTFFTTIFNEQLSYGECPECGHEDHWLIPVDELAQMGWIINQEDPAIPKATSIN